MNEQESLLARDLWAAAEIKRYRETGDLAIRDAVFEVYRPLTKMTAARIAHPMEERDDMLQEMAVGLCKAIEEWKPFKGARFSTWAIAKMRYAGVEYVRTTLWGTRTQQTTRRDAERRTTEIENGAEMSADEVENGGAIMPPHYDMPPRSLDERLRGGSCDNEIYLRDTVTAEINTEFEALQHVFHEEVVDSLGWLPEREQEVFRLYYYGGNTFREIGLLWGISESRIFQIHSQGMRRLRSRLKGYADEVPPVHPYTRREDIENGQRKRATPRRGSAQIAA